MDGSTCAIVYQVAGGLSENIRFSPPGHEKSDEIVEDILFSLADDELLIVSDISISYDFAKKLDTVWGGNPPIQIIDHHKSAIPLDEFKWCEIDVENTRAGGLMLYDYLLRCGLAGEDGRLHKYRKLVEYADDHDRWVKRYPESDTLATLHNTLEQKIFIERFLKNNRLDLTVQEQYLLDLEDLKRESYIRVKKKQTVIYSQQIGEDVVKVAYVLADDHQSALGQAIYEDPEMDVGVVIMIGGSTLSMRAHPDCPVDLSIVSKLNNGGGHKGSAGCSISNVLGSDLIELIKEGLKFE